MAKLRVAFSQFCERAQKRSFRSPKTSGSDNAWRYDIVATANSVTVLSTFMNIILSYLFQKKNITRSTEGDTPKRRSFYVFTLRKRAQDMHKTSHDSITNWWGSLNLCASDTCKVSDYLLEQWFSNNEDLLPHLLKTILLGYKMK